MCKAGCGAEKTKGQCDTPGFKLSTESAVKTDHRRCQKLQMARNHPRVTQTSHHMIQSWRANCDVQILCYNSDPKSPDLSEIARITDYIVSYSCKGNTTWKEESEQIKKLIKASEDLSGDKNDVKRLAKQVMNKAASKRLISKQEAMVLLTELPLVTCTESIESISINNSKTLKLEGESKSDQRLVTRYSKRPEWMSPMSLYDYFIYTYNEDPNRKNKKKYTIPNFCGISGTPKFPVTEGYARHSIIVHMPWRTYPTGLNWIDIFNEFINSNMCPKACRMSYDRVMQRHYHKLTFYDPKSQSGDHTKNVMSLDDEELAILLGLSSTTNTEGDYETALFKSMDKGEHYAWDTIPKVSSQYVSISKLDKIPYMNYLTLYQS